MERNIVRNGGKRPKQRWGEEKDRRKIYVESQRQINRESVWVCEEGEKNKGKIRRGTDNERGVEREGNREKQRERQT